MVYKNNRGVYVSVVMNRHQALELFKQFHASPLGGHTGMNKTEDAISTRFYWRAMHNDIRHWVKYTVLPLSTIF